MALLNKKGPLFVMKPFHHLRERARKLKYHIFLILEVDWPLLYYFVQARFIYLFFSSCIIYIRLKDLMQDINYYDKLSNL